MTNTLQQYYPLILNLIPRIRAAFSLHPKEVVGRLLLKSGRLSQVAAKMTILGELKRKRPGRIPEIMYDIERQYSTVSGESSPDYTGKNILEIGCGIRGGIGPLAVVRNANSYLGIDPNVIPEIFSALNIRQQYLEPALNETAKMEGVWETPHTYLTDFDNSCSFTQSSLEDLVGEQMQYDLAVSISCLEHISQLDEALRILKRIMTPSAQHFHLVNFSNHLSKSRPFSKIYEMTPEEYWRRHGHHINLLRPDDIKDAFNKAGWHVDVTPLDSRIEALPSATMDPWWTENYEENQLAIRTAVISTTHK